MSRYVTYPKALKGKIAILRLAGSPRIRAHVGSSTSIGTTVGPPVITGG